MTDINELLQLMVERDASDLFLRTNAYPRLRIHGKMETVSTEKVSLDEMVAVTNLLLENELRRRTLAENQGIDFIYHKHGLGRFRVNVFIQRGTPALVARHVKQEIRSFEDLQLPADVLKLFCQETRGLVLVCGPAGNGKSTAVASMIEHVNQSQMRHILTVEDPIEFLYEDKKSLINQRELEIDVPDYVSALKHVTQQSPDIIYIGNIRDQETMRAAITATELGAFVMTTFHTVNAVQTIIRMVNFFPPHLHDEVRMQLSLILKGTISLRLLPTKDGKGRVPAFETLVNTPTIARLIRENKITEIQPFIDKGESSGMQSFKQSYVKLVKAGLVDAEEARKVVDSKDEFDMALKGVKERFD